jgi:hypothetical protein
MVIVERLVYSQSKKVEKWGEGESIMGRIDGVVNYPGMQEGPRFDVTCKGNRVPTSSL